MSSPRRLIALSLSASIIALAAASPAGAADPDAAAPLVAPGPVDDDPPAPAPSDLQALDAALAELDRLIATVGPGPAAAALHQAIRAQLVRIHQFDLNADGRVHYLETIEQTARQYAAQQGPEAAERYRTQQIDQMRTYHERADLNRDGQVDPPEQFASQQITLDDHFARIADQHGPEAAERARADWEKRRRPYLDRYDADDDGEVTWAEFTGYHAREAEAQAGDWLTRRQLLIYDADGDGQLNSDERRRLTDDRSAADATSRNRAAATLARYDLDHDGRLSPAELDAMHARVDALLDELADVAHLARIRAARGDRSLDPIATAIRTARFSTLAPSNAPLAPLHASPTTPDPDPTPRRPLVDE